MRSTPEEPTTESMERVRLVLLAPPEHTNDRVAAKVGMSREWTRRVRRGEIFADLFRELPRLLPPSQRLCTCCEHWIFRDHRVNGARKKGICGLGHKEPEVIGIRYGLGCGAFAARLAERAVAQEVGK